MYLSRSFTSISVPNCDIITRWIDHHHHLVLGAQAGLIVGMLLSIMCTIQEQWILMKMSRIYAAKRRISVERSLRKQALKLTSVWLHQCPQVWIIREVLQAANSLMCLATLNSPFRKIWHWHHNPMLLSCHGLY